MCADDDVDGAIGEFAQNILGLFGSAGSREVIDPDREVLESLAEGLEMLEGEDGGRHEHSHLLAVVARLEGSANGHLGLAETHVAAHQSVHRLFRLHVALHVLCSLELVGCVFVDERSLHLVLHVGVGREGKALFVLACGIEQDEFARHVLHLLLGAFLHLLPRARTESAQRRRLGIAAAVFRELVELMDRYEEKVVVEVDELDHLLHLL